MIKKYLTFILCFATLFIGLIMGKFFLGNKRQVVTVIEKKYMGIREGYNVDTTTTITENK